jgi:hypothetical protein
MTQIMVAYEKHGSRYLSMSKGVGYVARALLKERLDAGRYYGEVKIKAEEALSGTDPRLPPWLFLIRRNGAEYEDVEIVDLEELA